MNFEQMVSQLGNCRYAECAFSLLAGHEILACEGESDYQGSASIVAKRTSAVEGFYEYLYLTWTWGSCSGCDAWEDQDLSGDQIVEEMRKFAAYFETKEQLVAFLLPLKEHSWTGETAISDWAKGELS